MRGRVDAEGDAAGGDDGKGAAGEDRGAAQRLDDEGPGGAVHHHGAAEVARERCGEPAPILQPERVVQAEPGAQGGEGGGRRIFPEDGIGDVARQDVNDGEDEDRRRQQDECHAQQAAGDIGGQDTVAWRRSNQRIGWVWTPATAFR